MAVSKKAVSKKAAGSKAVGSMVVTKKVAVKKAAVKIAKVVLTDDEIDIAEFDLANNSHIPLEKIKVSRAAPALETITCIQGKQSRVTRDNPKMAPPINTANYIVSLHVTLSAQNLQITWLDGTVENTLCSPNPQLTPKLNDVVGFKCGGKHTNFKRDGMAWFTALKSKGMAYGFHNSQRVGIGVVSHGCIRVPCAHAKRINQNSWSGKTKIKIVK